jgi:hypothetical protein
MLNGLLYAEQWIRIIGLVAAIVAAISTRT